MSTLAQVFAYGALGSRAAAAAGNTNYYYWATDTKQLFQSNGAAWVQVAAATGQLQVLVDGATVNWDMSLGNGIVTLAGNRTIAAPTNLPVGMVSLRIVQDATGSRTLTWNALFKWVGGTAPTLTTTAAHYDVLTFYCDGTNLYQQSVALDVH